MYASILVNNKKIELSDKEFDIIKHSLHCYYLDRKLRIKKGHFLGTEISGESKSRLNEIVSTCENLINKLTIENQ